MKTNDRIVAVNGAPMMTGTELRAMLSRVRIGDTVTVDVRRPRGPARVTVVVSGYNRPVVRIREVPEPTERQRKLRARWLSGAP
ncbi:MAG: PDZ domain-containing protein [Gemmatimonadaceae bacterium]|nr:PDZ domain-containing protein [Gemmatimonadaceae bacterium]